MNASLKEHLCSDLEDTSRLNMRALYILAQCEVLANQPENFRTHQQNKHEFFPIPATLVNIRQHERDILVITKKLNT